MLEIEILLISFVHYIIRCRLSVYTKLTMSLAWISIATWVNHPDSKKKFYLLTKIKLHSEKKVKFLFCSYMTPSYIMSGILDKELVLWVGYFQEKRRQFRFG